MQFNPNEMKKFYIVLLAILILSGCNQAKNLESESMPPAPQEGAQVMEKNDDDMMIPIAEEDDSMIPIDDSEEAMMDKGVFRNKLVFTQSKGVQEGEGEGYYGVMEGETRVYASFNVPKAEEDYFYEGWLVCNGQPYSTGKLEFFDGIYENIFASMEIPENCEQYVLTLEPNDGDPAPAEHILEGNIEGIAHTEPMMDWNAEVFSRLIFGPVQYTCADSFQFTLTKDPLSDDKLFYTPLETGVSTTVIRTEAASGEKYTSEDNKLSLWSKGEVVMIMQDEEITHEDCQQG